MIDAANGGFLSAAGVPVAPPCAAPSVPFAGMAFGSGFGAGAVEHPTGGSAGLVPIRLRTPSGKTALFYANAVGGFAVPTMQAQRALPMATVVAASPNDPRPPVEQTCQQGFSHSQPPSSHSELGVAGAFDEMLPSPAPHDIDLKKQLAGNGLSGLQSTHGSRNVSDIQPNHVENATVEKDMNGPCQLISGCQANISTEEPFEGGASTQQPASTIDAWDRQAIGTNPGNSCFVDDRVDDGTPSHSHSGCANADASDRGHVQAQTAVCNEFRVGDIVYRHGELASVVHVDRQLQPPSYTVRVAQTGCEVNCEGGHLVSAISSACNQASLASQGHHAVSLNNARADSSGLIQPAFTDMLQRQHYHQTQLQQFDPRSVTPYKQLAFNEQIMHPENRLQHVHSENGHDINAERLWCAQHEHLINHRGQHASDIVAGTPQGLYAAQLADGLTPFTHCSQQGFETALPHDRVMMPPCFERSDHVKNHALEALTEALDRAEVSMLRGRKQSKETDVDKARLVGDSGFALPLNATALGGPASTNFALQAVDEALGNAGRAVSSLDGSCHMSSRSRPHAVPLACDSAMCAGMPHAFLTGYADSAHAIEDANSFPLFENTRSRDAVGPEASDQAIGAHSRNSCTPQERDSSCISAPAEPSRENTPPAIAHVQETEDQSEKLLPETPSESVGGMDLEDDEDDELEILARKEMDEDEVIDFSARPRPKPPMPRVANRGEGTSRQNVFGRRPLSASAAARRPRSAGRSLLCADAAQPPPPVRVGACPPPKGPSSGKLSSKLPEQHQKIQKQQQQPLSKHNILEKRDMLVNFILQDTLPCRSMTPARKAAPNSSRRPSLPGKRSRSVPSQDLVSPTFPGTPLEHCTSQKPATRTPRENDASIKMVHESRSTQVEERANSPRGCKRSENASEWKVQRADPVNLPSLPRLRTTYAQQPARASVVAGPNSGPQSARSWKQSVAIYA
eukprot:TRINITY_DN68125_c0_g1_i1.p1 TRINITY_DN68125_c0_g1~~TRINITY_DN68125_c0_g1_i1.p1  ORF type:complete len:982 (+),score=100.35 TRINITY_DN68125_c0_g1_i1:42-2948(+)